MTPTVVRPRIDRDRLLGRLDALSSIGDTGDGGVCRLALSDEDREARDLVRSWLRELGLRVEIDAIGNMRGTWPADDHSPAVMTGSHIDTVRTGGRLDGNLGVLAGLEVVQAVAEACDGAGVRPDRPICVAVFTGEEGARFPPDMVGSLVQVGGLPLEEALGTVGIDGTVLGEELVRIGYAGPAPCPGPVPHAFVELHVEQGPVLERGGHQIGAVTGVQGISWQELTITGQSNHAGTTPMAMRHDAGYVAARLTTFVRDLAGSLGGDQVATVGRTALVPDLVNVVPGRAVLTVDLRNTDGATLEEAEHRLAEACEDLARAEGVTIGTRTLARFDPVDFDPEIVELVERTATGLGHPVRRLPSGAGHDAQMMARVCPAGMVFVPSIGGISHNPAEDTRPEDLVAGAEVLLAVVRELGNRRHALRTARHA
jgi:N-carbamoyl-L-amino-acid hydrolase